MPVAVPVRSFADEMPYGLIPVLAADTVFVTVRELRVSVMPVAASVSDPASTGARDPTEAGSV